MLTDDCDVRTAEDAIGEISNLMIPECSGRNWKTIINGLTKLLLDADDRLQGKIVDVLIKFRGKFSEKSSDF